MNSAQDRAAFTAAAVRAYFGAAGMYFAEVARQNPGLTPVQVAARPDVGEALAQASADASSYVLEAVTEAWEENGGDPSSPALRHLLRDVHRSYGSVTLARHSGQPGIGRLGRDIALRNSLTVQYAVRAATVEASLTAARLRDNGRLRKRWVAHPENPACCTWCRRLHNVTIPLHADFSPYIGGPVDLSGSGRLTQPPKPYLGMLQGPQLHPNCNCDLVIVSEGDDPLEGPEAELPGYLTAAEIRSMSPEKYRAMIGFLHAAAHQLELVLDKLANTT